MNRNRFNRPSNAAQKQGQPHRRSGSILLVVVALMGMMAFLGFVIYTFAAQERINSLNFAESAKERKAPSIEPDTLFDFALQQIIIGPNDTNFQSILWGGRHSLLANMYGRDGIPWNGEGVNLVADVNGNPWVDMDYNGGTDNDGGVHANLQNFVDTPAANGTSVALPIGSGSQFGSNSVATLPAPDVNYNGPDINSMFLSYDGMASDTANNQTRVMIPSYFRPQYLRNSGSMISNWYANAATKNQVMRPHPNHVCMDSSGNVLTFDGTTAIPRYVSTTDGFASYSSLGLRRPFTAFGFQPETPAGGVSSGNMGVWNKSGLPFDMSLDVDTDGDGIMDAILMDLGHPPIRRGDGKLVVPLFAISIRDLNGLLNVNATGNMGGNLNVNSMSVNNQLGSRATGGTAGAYTYTADNLSKSNMGLTTYEINPQRALTADPNNDSGLVNSEAALQLSYFLKQFDPSITTSPAQPGRSIVELANLEWLMLNMGRAQFHLGLAQTASPLQYAISDVFPGRHGEYSSARTFLSNYSTFGSFYLPRAGQSVNSWTNPTYDASGNMTALPIWGSFAGDDDNNFNEGEANSATRWVNPLDFSGTGVQFRRYGFGADGQPGVAGTDDDGNGIIDDGAEAGWSGSDDPVAFPGFNVTYPLLTLKDPTTGALIWPAYSGYQSYYHAVGSVVAGSVVVAPSVVWGESASTGATNSAKLMRNSSWTQQLDHPVESVIDPVLMSPNYSGTLSAANPVPNPVGASINNTSTNDMVFGPEELPFLQGSNMDDRLTDSRSRLADLMPANLVASLNAADIRKRFTTVSTDRREFGFATYPIGQLRTWESSPLFPSPHFPPGLSAGTPNPYRPELFYFIYQISNQINNQINPSLKLNVNRLLYLGSANPNLFPPQYGFAPLPPLSTAGDTVNDVAAAIARQNMARDIYTLLYTLCHVHYSGVTPDVDYRTATAPTAAQAKEMAQFAVNLVDALDTDNVMTAFYYDPDLTSAGNGWDNVYGVDTMKGTKDDTVVYGVERQSLTFTEVMSLSVKTTTPDSKATIFDDTATGPNGRLYVYFELENVCPMNVNLASSGVTSANATSKGDWRVRLQDATGNDLRILYFLNGGLDLPNNLVNSDGSGNKYLTPGQQFTVSSQDGTDTFSNNASGTYRTSDFRLSTDNSGTNFTLIIPSIGAGGALDNSNGRTSPPTSGLPGATFPTAKCNLDLAWDGLGALPSTRFFITDGNGTSAGINTSAGTFASAIGANTTITLLLERRAADGFTNGRWATVDSNTVSVGQYTPPAAMAAVNFQNSSSYRKSPLFRTLTASAPGSTMLNLTTKFVAAANAWTWQWQPDRDFATLADLFLVPMYGPADLTNGAITTSEFYQYTDANAKLTYAPTVAAARFLRPDNPDVAQNLKSGELAGITNFGNRWYRLLDFLEVPNRGHQHPVVLGLPPTSSNSTLSWGGGGTYGTSAVFTPFSAFPPTLGTTAFTTIPSVLLSGVDNFPLMEPYNLPQFFGWPRTHGLINLNMIRHPQVLAALVDDDQLINDPRFTGANPWNLYSTDEPVSTNRDWWLQFVKARDSRKSYTSINPGTSFDVDPVTQLYVPGVASGRPFRGYDSIGTTAASLTDSPLENTILRSLPASTTDANMTGNPNEYRRLFEIGIPGLAAGTGEHFGQLTGTTNEVTNTPLHPAARYRALSKLMNNTTTRSNSFAVYITAQYYEAAEVNSNSGVTAIRIGGKLTDAPVHRAFFVIDRTGAVEQMKNLTTYGINPLSPNGTFSFVPNTNTTGVRANMNGIRWKDLVLFRQTLN